MFFFLLHHLFTLLFDGVLTDLRRNCITFLLGTVLYVLCWGFLFNRFSHWLAQTIQDFFWYFVVADVAVMAIIYRSYYGRSIVSELDPDSQDKYDWNDDDHQYRKSKLAVKEALMDDGVKEMHRVIGKSEETLGDLEEAKEKIEEFENDLQNLESNVNELDMAIRYAPGGEIAQKAQTDFETRMMGWTKENGEAEVEAEAEGD